MYARINHDSKCV